MTCLCVATGVSPNLSLDGGMRFPCAAEPDDQFLRTKLKFFLLGDLRSNPWVETLYLSTFTAHFKFVHRT
jgi:hypothetical protein